MREEQPVPGLVTVDTSVLELIARLTALDVAGVVAVAERDMDKLLGISSHGVSVEVQNDKVIADLHLIAGPEVSLLQLGRKVQYEVTRAIQKMLGMSVEAVNIHFEDVVYPERHQWDAEEPVE